MSVRYTSDADDWVRCLDTSLTRATLLEAVREWQPFVDDALAVVEAMDDKAFLQWRSGLRKERRGTFAGMKFAKRFGALLMPTEFVKAAGVAQRFKVPLGLALVRLREQREGSEGGSA